MSVPQIDREPLKDLLQVQSKAYDFAAFMVKLLSNQHFLPKKHRWAFNRRMVDKSFDVAKEIDLANEIWLCPENLSSRRSHQDAASGLLKNLLTDIHILNSLKRLPQRKLMKTVGAIKELLGLIDSWRRSDETR